jgi:YidC/Oxa1 family membrane protein insertase
MSEFRVPVVPRLNAVRWFLFAILMVGLLWDGWRLFRETGVDLWMHLRHSAVMNAARGTASMNVLERELFVALDVVHGHLPQRVHGDWGWSIVVLTIGVNLLVLPLRVKTMRSARAMQRLQPEMEAIKRRYGDLELTDPRRAEMNAEVMKLQREHGVNPLGGCLPMLIQMPLLLGFFGMLRKAAVLRGARWYWLKDLSLPDPYHVLPVLMVAAQLVVQWSTPSPGAGVGQQRMVAGVMVIVFGYVSFHYASAVALYSLTGSMFSIGTQAIWGREKRS